LVPGASSCSSSWANSRDGQDGFEVRAKRLVVQCLGELDSATFEGGLSPLDLDEPVSTELWGHRDGLERAEVPVDRRPHLAQLVFDEAKSCCCWGRASSHSDCTFSTARAMRPCHEGMR
jgi:hypothetical protein